MHRLFPPPGRFCTLDGKRTLSAPWASWVPLATDRARAAAEIGTQADRSERAGFCALGVVVSEVLAVHRGALAQP